MTRSAGERLLKLLFQWFRSRGAARSLPQAVRQHKLECSSLECCGRLECRALTGSFVPMLRSGVRFNPMQPRTLRPRNLGSIGDSCRTFSTTTRRALRRSYSSCAELGFRRIVTYRICPGTRFELKTSNRFLVLIQLEL